MTIPEEQKLTTYFEASARKFKTSEVVKYNTAGDGNCFFHAVFGDNSSGIYKAERAQDMRMEWHKFLTQPLSAESRKVGYSAGSAMRS